MILLDTRPEADFLKAHHPEAANVPLEQLAARSHELPPASEPVGIADCDPECARKASEFLQMRGHEVGIVPCDRASLTASGPPSVRLWRPNPFLVEALNLIRFDSRPPRAMDVACGSGRDAVYLALNGFDVLAIDWLPDALDRANDLASRNGVAIRTACVDLEQEMPPRLQSANLVAVFRFLHRPLFPALREAVAPTGYIIYETFHEKNLQTGHGPRKSAHLLATGELQRAFESFEILIYRDGYDREGRFFSSLLARRPEGDPLHHAS